MLRIISACCKGRVTVDSARESRRSTRSAISATFEMRASDCSAAASSRRCRDSCQDVLREQVDFQATLPPARPLRDWCAYARRCGRRDRVPALPTAGRASKSTARRRSCRRPAGNIDHRAGGRAPRTLHTRTHLQRLKSKNSAQSNLLQFARQALAIVRRH